MNERGGMFVLILVACILLAMLFYVFAKGTNTSTVFATKGQAKTTVIEIKDYSTSVKRTIEKLLLNGCSEKDLRFYYPLFQNASDYAGQAGFGNTSTNSCYVFDPANPAATTWHRVPSAVKNVSVDYLFNGGTGVYNIGSNSCALTELTVIIPVTKQVCIEYNNVSGVQNPSGVPPLDDAANNYFNADNKTPKNATKFGWSGLYFGCGTFIGHPSNSPSGFAQLARKTSGCFQSHSLAGPYLAYEVLLAR